MSEAKDVRLMTLAEVDAELAEIGERKRLLLDVRKLLVRLAGGEEPSGE